VPIGGIVRTIVFHRGLSLEAWFTGWRHQAPFKFRLGTLDPGLPGPNN
jgi:hypothetical protein